MARPKMSAGNSTEPATAEVKYLTRFDVTIENSTGETVALFPGVIAQTRSEAVNRVKQSLTYSAERSN